MKSFKHAGIILVVGFLGFLAYFAPSVCLVKNISESLPFSYFIAFPIKESKRGMFVLFEHPKESILVGKKIVGLPGDEIKIEKRVLYINESIIAEIKEKSPSGIDLKPISEGKIDGPYVFVIGSHPLSFDSRYAEFGLIPISHLRKQLWPLF